MQKNAFSKLTVGLSLLLVLPACVTGGVSFGNNSGDSDILAPLGGGVIASLDEPRVTGVLREQALRAEYEALRSSPGAAPVAWGSSDGSIVGEATAGQPYRVGTQDCRPVVQVVRISGLTRQLTGAACQEPDGRWARVG